MEGFSGTLTTWGILILIPTFVLMGVSFYSARKRKEEWYPRPHHFILWLISIALLLLGDQKILKANSSEGKTERPISTIISSNIPSGPNGVNIIHYRALGDSVVYESVKQYSIENGAVSFQVGGVSQTISNFRIVGGK